jgi:hypothetical protein
MKNYEEISEKVEPLKRLGGARTLEMCVEMSDAMLRIRNIEDNPTNTYENALTSTLELLERAKVPYMLTGAVASSYYGLPRTTYDIDLMVLPEAANAEKLVDLAREADFRVHKQEVLELVKVGNRFIMQSREGYRIDFWLVRTEYERTAFERRRRTKVYNRTAWISSPEDVILCKLRSGRPRDITDIEGVLARQRKLDEKYLLSWASRFGLADSLKRLMKKGK